MKRGKLLLQFVNEHRLKMEIDYYRNARPLIFEGDNVIPNKRLLMSEREDMKIFLKNYLSLILEKNRINDWEMDNRSGKQSAIKLLDEVNLYGTYSDIDVYEFGKKGIELVFKKLPDGPKFSFYSSKSAVDIFSVKALPACETMFYRDWKHDGICVHQTEEYDEPW